MKTSVLLWITAILTISGVVYFISTLPEMYREEGRNEVEAKYEKISNTAILKLKSELDVKNRDLKFMESQNEISKLKQEKAFADYKSDVRAGRVPGLYINKNSICASGSGKAGSASGDEKSESVRLPTKIEEDLFEFGQDRDRIIADFNDFKAHVKRSGCYKD